MKDEHTDDDLNILYSAFILCQTVTNKKKNVICMTRKVSSYIKGTKWLKVAVKCYCTVKLLEANVCSTGDIAVNKSNLT